MGHFHSHSHGAGHHHDHHHEANQRVLVISFALIFSFMLVEAAGGWLTKSLALLSDAGHMLSDAFALGLSLFALTIGKKGADANKTFGYRRFEILAALVNGITLILIALYIFWEAYQRALDPPEVMGSGMLAVATVGLAVNAFVAVILFKGNRENLNIRSALLHVLGDLLGSVGAIVASVFILAFGWNLADPIVSVLVALLVLTGGWRVTGEAVHILMEGKPTSLSITQIKKSLQALSGVRDVHDLHVWSITSGFHSFSCHLVVGQEVDRDLLLQKASEMLEEKFGIRHTTIQMEGERSRIIEDENCCN